MFIKDFRVLNINRVNAIFVACEMLSHLHSQIPNFESRTRVSNFSLTRKTTINKQDSHKFWEHLGFKIGNSGNYVFGFAFATIETHFLC